MTGWSARFASASKDTTLHAYEEIMVPRLFEPWAQLLAERLAIAPGETVVDVACGPGTVARVTAARVGPDGHVVGADFSPAMIAIARSKPVVVGGAPIEYVEAPADMLPLPSRMADVVTCQQGCQFFPNRPAAFAEMRRVLRPGGRLGVAVWRDVSECPPFAALAGAVREVLGAEAAALYRSGPWGLTDTSELAELLDGFGDVSISRHELPLVFDGGAAQLVDTLAVTGVADGVTDATRPHLVDAVTRTAAAITDAAGTIRSSAASNILLGRRP